MAIEWDDKSGRSTGVRRLDDLLGGRLPYGGATLLIGPPFAGKRAVSRAAVARALDEDAPVVIITTDRTAEETRQALRGRVDELAKHEKKGRLTYIDTCSCTFGREEAAPQAHYLDTPDLETLLDETADALGDAAGALVVVDTASTLLLGTTRPAFYAFALAFGSLLRASEAVGLVLATAGMHPAEELVALRHTASRVVEMKTDYGGRVLRVEGVAGLLPDTWIEYTPLDHAIDITGSLSANRIR